jgi:hypothetical protein
MQPAQRRVASRWSKPMLLRQRFCRFFLRTQLGDNAGYPQVSIMDRSSTTFSNECVTILATDFKDPTAGPDGKMWMAAYNVIGRLNIRIFKDGFEHP